MNECPQCTSIDWDYANVGLPNAVQCRDCGYIYPKPRQWVEITKRQIDDCLQHSDNYDFAWAIEHICRLNNGYPAHKNFRPAVTKSHKVSGSIKWSKSK